MRFICYILLFFVEHAPPKEDILKICRYEYKCLMTIMVRIYFATEHFIPGHFASRHCDTGHFATDCKCVRARARYLNSQLTIEKF